MQQHPTKHLHSVRDLLNLSAGPAKIPAAVLARVQKQLWDWNNTGLSVFELYHRQPIFVEFIHELKDLLRTLLGIPKGYSILLLHGGARVLYSLIPMNFININPSGACFYDIGHWSNLAAQQAHHFGKVTTLFSGADHQYCTIDPAFFSSINQQYSYCHYVSNETLNGLALNTEPCLSIPLVVDMTSDLMTKTIDVSNYQLIYASAQKNLGLAGLSLVIIEDAFLAKSCLPEDHILGFKSHAQDPLGNCTTPPIFSLFVMYHMLSWLHQEGGVAVMERNNQAKARCLYEYIDQSSFYYNEIDPHYRSTVNISFHLYDSSHQDAFLAYATKKGVVGLKGHKCYGGFRASIYNAITLNDVTRLIELMESFSQQHKVKQV
jgi:phosphoserine aminotransferase